MHADDDSTDAGVRDEHVRSAAEERDRQIEPSGCAQRAADIVGPCGVDQPVGGPSHFERRQRRERRLRPRAIAERGAQVVSERHG
jgi:hypothetical protein